MKKKILIIGGLGFVGSHLAEACLDQGYEVTILSKSINKIKNIDNIKERVKLILIDVKNIGKEVSGFDYIVHLAGSTDNYAIIENDIYKDIQLNCNTTIALLEACRLYNLSARILFASTFFVNGNQTKLPVNEDSPCNPLGLYGATKLAAEHFCHIYHNIFGLDTIIARFTNVFGDREQGSPKKAGFNYLISLAVKGQELKIYNNGDFFRDYIYVTDVASACLTILEKGTSDKIYYVGRGEFIKFKELIDIIVKETGAKIVPIDPPDFHKKVGIKNFVCDTSSLKALGWNPAVSIEEGIKKTINYYKNLI